MHLNQRICILRRLLCVCRDSGQIRIMSLFDFYGRVNTTMVSCHDCSLTKIFEGVYGLFFSIPFLYRD